MITAAPLDRVWPPECCVPAFVHAALLSFGVGLADVDALPARLGVRIRPDQKNPLGLALATDSNPPGIRAVDADREINKLFAELQVPLAFRRVPFLEITLDLWDEVLKTALDRKIVTALGLDYTVLTGLPGSQSAQHVMRVKAQTRDSVQLLDDSGESEPANFAWVHVESAVLAVPDGFWMIGRAADLDLPWTLPWREQH